MKKIHGARPCIYGANNWTRSIIAHYSYSLLSFSFNTKRLRITIFSEKMISLAYTIFLVRSIVRTIRPKIQFIARTSGIRATPLLFIFLMRLAAVGLRRKGCWSGVDHRRP